MLERSFERSPTKMGASDVLANKNPEDNQITLPATTMLIIAWAAYPEI